jgi:hypothetical protein
MSNIIRTIACTVLILAFGAVPAARAQNIPSKKEAKIFLRKAATDSDLRGSGAAPFHLLANFKYTLDNNTVDGTYELFWAAPDKYREYFKMADVVETDIAAGHKLSVERSTKAIPLPLWRIQQSLRAPVLQLVGADPNVKKVYTDRSSGDPRTCVEFESNYARPQACFDLNTNAINAAIGGIYGRYAGSQFRINEFVSIGGKRFPRHIYLTALGETIDLHIATLESQTSFDDTVFTPGPKAEVRDWCPEPTQKGGVKWPHPPGVWGLGAPPMAPPGNFSAYYLWVSRDGQVANIIGLRTGPAEEDRRMQAMLHDAKFPVRRCGDSPIDYEIIITGSRFGPYGTF